MEGLNGTDSRKAMWLEELQNFLKDHVLAEYEGRLVGMGFDSVETLCSITEEQMKEVGVKPGHRNRLRDALVKRSQPVPPPFLMPSSSWSWEPIAAATVSTPCFAPPPPFPWVPPLWPLVPPPMLSVPPMLGGIHGFPLPPSVVEVFIISLLRLAQDNSERVDAELLQQLGFHWGSYGACKTELMASTAVQEELVKRQSEIKENCPDDSRQDVTAQLMNLHDEYSDMAQERATKALNALRQWQQCGLPMHTIFESGKAAADITQQLFLKARREPEFGKRLENSFRHFEAYRACLESGLENPAGSTEVILALLTLRLATKDLPAEPPQDRSNGPKMAPTAPLAHALKTIIMLIAIKRAGCHSDRDLFEEALDAMIPKKSSPKSYNLLERASSQMRELSPEARHGELLSIRSSIFQCFKKVLGDVPGAFVSKNKTPQRNGQQQRLWKKSMKRRARPMEAGLVTESQSTDEPATDSTEPGSSSHDNEEMAAAREDQVTSYIVKNTFIDICEPKPLKSKICQSEPAGKGGRGTSSVGFDNDLDPLLEEPEGDEDRQILVVTEMNFTTVHRDFHGNYAGQRQFYEYGFDKTRMYIRPAATDFIAKLLAEQRFTLLLTSCSGWHHASNLAKKLLEVAAPDSSWRWQENWNECKLPCLVSDNCRAGQRQVFLAYDKWVNTTPPDYKESQKKAVVKDSQIMLDALPKSGCTHNFDIDNMVMIDTERGTNTLAENVVRIPSWTVNSEDEKPIFEPLFEYLVGLSENMQTDSTCKIPRYLHEHP
jgi:hypothetical protein